MFGWLLNIWVWDGKTSLLSFCEIILPHTSLIILLLRSFYINHSFFIQYNDLLPPTHVALYWGIVRTKCYQALPLVTYWMKYWPRFFNTRACLQIWLTRKRMPLFANSCYHMNVDLSLYSFNLFQNLTFYGCDVDWTQWNKGWRILFWYSCRQACCNILDARFYALREVLQWKHKLSTVFLYLYKVIINHWTPSIWSYLLIGDPIFIREKWLNYCQILGIYGEGVQIIPSYCLTHIYILNLTLPNV